MKFIILLLACAVMMGVGGLATHDISALSCETDEQENCMEMPHAVSVLKQFQSGTSIGDIFCHDSTLVIKKSTGTPACVVNDAKLIERGWAVTLDDHIRNGPDVEIILDQGPCLGSCPVYTVTITNDGMLVFDRIENLEMLGTEMRTIDSRDIANLISHINEIDYFSLEDTYDVEITDIPRTVTTITIGDKTNSITSIPTDIDNFKVAELESMINHLANPQNNIDGANAGLETETRTLYIDSKLVDCVGVGPQQCMLIRESPDSEWSLFYDSIAGFDFQKGTQYKINVDITKVEDPPIDGSSLKYTLIDILESSEILPPVDVTNVVAANNQFALDFYSNVSQGSDANIFFSPWSISTAAAIIYEGAHGNTAEEMQQVFDFPSDPDTRQSEFQSANYLLNQENSEYRLDVANALWIQEGFVPYTEYVDIASIYYDSHVDNVDFKTDGADVVNQWVSEKTQDKITELFPQGPIPNVKLAITNAIYFNGTWVKPFPEAQTKDAPFWIAPDQSIDVPMMDLYTTYLNSTLTNDLQIIQLPYRGDKLSMLIILPHEKDGLSSIEESLSVEDLDDWQNSLSMRKIDLYIPKFELKTDYNLKLILANLGMTDAFDKQTADFSGMSDSQLLIDEMIHKAFVNVDEKGTEAAAATGMIMEESLPPQLRVDHPFLFVIQDDTTGNILFIGRVMNPLG